MFLKTKRREMHTAPEHLRLRQNTNTAYTINLHLHIWITIGITEVGEVRTPGSVFSVPFDDDGVFVESVGELQGGFGFLPGVEVVGLFAS